MREMRFFGSGFGVMLGACATAQVVPPVPVSAPVVALEQPDVREEVIHEIALDGVLLRFWGSRVPMGVRESFGVTALDFVFGSNEPQRFVPSGALHFSDWRFDIVSPDEAHLLLLQDRYGPYHVVRVDQLQGYLNGAEPAYQFGYQNPEGSAWIHEGARWVGSTTVNYRAGLTTTMDFEFELD